MITAMSRRYPNQLDYRPTRKQIIQDGINSYNNPLNIESPCAITDKKLVASIVN
jgi:hypothetical protein